MMVIQIRYCLRGDQQIPVELQTPPFLTSVQRSALNIFTVQKPDTSGQKALCICCWIFLTFSRRWPVSFVFARDLQPALFIDPRSGILHRVAQVCSSLARHDDRGSMLGGVVEQVDVHQVAEVDGHGPKPCVPRCFFGASARLCAWHTSAKLVQMCLKCWYSAHGDLLVCCHHGHGILRSRQVDQSVRVWMDGV
jgi:hypothetical protein